MLKKHLNSSDYWSTLAKANEYDYGRLRTILLNDRGACGIVAALLIGINLAAIPTVQTDTDFSILLFFFIMMHAASGMLALVSLWLGTQQYLKINMLTPYRAFCYRLGMKWYDEPIGYMVASLVTLPIAFTCGLSLSHPLVISVPVICLCIVFLLIAIALAVRSALKYHTAITICEPSPSGDALKATPEE